MTTAHPLQRISYMTALVYAVFLLFFVSPLVSAQNVDELREKIEERSEQIAQLEAEIAQYEAELTDIAGEKQSLEGEIRRLDVSQKKLLADISLTQQKINSAVLEIENLTADISDKGARIERDREAIARAMRNINQANGNTLVETLLVHDDLGSFWEDVESLQRFQITLQEELAAVRTLKSQLETTRSAEEQKRHELVGLREELRGRERVLDQTKAEQEQLLAQTQNEEARYQQILAEAQERKRAFEQELFAFESELEFALDPSRIPPAGSGVLRWPLANPSPLSCWNGGADYDNCMTQFFGKTSDSGRLYASGTHNGIDFRATPGTRVSAALSGVVEGVGNTDLYNGCYSYGKWVLLKHNNGLATLYAHLSHISVSEGQQVTTGDIVGLSGNSGYSTGPHLHFTVYASQGVEVKQFTQSIGCKEAFIPLAPRDAYLDPMMYL